MKQIVGAVAVVLVVLVGLAAPASAAAPKPVVLYGDSLAWESSAPLTAALGAHYSLTNASVPTTAPCDWLPRLASDLATYHPAVVTLATAGNTQGPGSCEQNPIGSPAYFADYTNDLTTFVQQVTASGAQFVFVEDPPFLNAARDAAVIQINELEISLANEYHGVSVYTKIRKAMSTRSGGYEAYAKCLKTETADMGCSGGQIAIRTVSGDPNQIGLHLCPGGITWTDPPCATYSSGEVRFGKAIASATKHPKPVLP